MAKGDAGKREKSGEKRKESSTEEPVEFDLNALPDNNEVLKAIIRDLVKLLIDRDKELGKLRHRLLELLRRRFGKTSERIQEGQLDLFDEMIGAIIDETLAENGPEEAEKPESEEMKPDGEKGKKKGHGRKPLPEHLEREIDEILVEQEKRRCGNCDEDLVRFGEVVSEVLELRPVEFYVRKIVREKLACKKCEETIVTADLPPAPIEKGLAGASVLANVLVSKYQDHLPLERQADIFKRSRIYISPKTLGGWVGQCATLLEPIVKEMRKDLLKSHVVGSDDTPVKVCDKSLKKTRRGYLWTYRGDDEHPVVLFDYSVDRSHAGPVKILSGFEGYHQADAFSAYDEIYKSGKIVEVGCMAHVRRKFYEAQTSDSMRSTTALAYIGMLYSVEDAAKGLEPEVRKELRQKDAKPFLDRFGEWLAYNQPFVLPAGPIGVAITYAVNQWQAINRYLDDGSLSIDNNAVEREIRRVAVGRKNWIFFGSDEGGRRAATIYTLLASARRIGIDPYEYLKDVLERLPTHKARRIAELTPVGWKAARDQESEDVAVEELAGVARGSP